ncbi:MAG: hypothetical protein C0501_10100 [Isosphaera sp.]|nr:hypothetical protein [Isosphaera sp.]
MTVLLLPLLLSPTAPPEVAPAPAAVPAADQVAAWAADLSSPDHDRRRAAVAALVKAGPRAAPAVPVLVGLLNLKRDGVDEAVGVLAAIGPDAKAALPSLLALLSQTTSGYFVERVVGAVTRIDGPRPESTLALLVSSARCNPIYIVRTAYLADHAGRVVPHLVDLCGHKDVEVRRRALFVLGGLDTWDGLGGASLLGAAGRGAAGVPAALEARLADKVPMIRAVAAQAIANGAPELLPKAVPVVIASVTGGELVNRIPPYAAAAMFTPIPDRAADAVVPLLDHRDADVRQWAVQALAQLPVRGRLEALVADGKTDRARAGAAAALGFGGGAGMASVPVLKSALADRAFPVRFAAARSLVGMGHGAVAVPALVEGLKKPAVRQDAILELSGLGPAAVAAAPALRGLLADKNEAFALEAALALVRVAPADAAAAVPALTRGLAVKTDRAGRAARALADLGPAARAAVPDLVRAFGAAGASAGVRIAAAEAAARLDPAQATPATEVIVALMTDKKQAKGMARAEAAAALGRIGPGARAAVPVLVGLLKDDNTPFRHEVAVAAFRIDPSPAGPALAWIRDCLKDEGHEDRYDLAGHVATLGPAAAPLVPDLVALLGSKPPYYRARAAEALGAVGPAAAAALPQLREVAEKDPRVDIRKAAAAAVGKIAGK